MADANNTRKDFKAPPTLGKNSLYVNWKKEICYLLEYGLLCYDLRCYLVGILQRVNMVLFVQ